MHGIRTLRKHRNKKLWKLNLSLFWFQEKTIIRALVILVILLSMLYQSPIEASDEEVPLKKILKLDEEWAGDFDGMVERRMIRSLVTFSKTNYYQDRGQHRGVTYELLKEFEKTINKALKRNLCKKIKQLL